MPTYPYRCMQCGHELEELQSMTEDHLVHCPECHTDNLVRVMGTGGALIFKGSGFYLTDYKKEGKKPKPAETKKPDPPATPSTDGKKKT